MNASNTFLQPVSDSQKNNLREAIARLQKQQLLLGKKINLLEEKLDSVKQEYFSRIGILYTVIDQLNVKIFNYQEIERLMQAGLSFPQAKKSIENQIHKSKGKDKKHSSREEDIFIIEENKDLPIETGRTLKELYRKLTRKFHPDLVQDGQEKKKREEMMKKINAAFADKNISALTRMDEEDVIIDYEHATTDVLKKTLTQIITLIDMMNKEYWALLRSEWNSWRKRIEKGKRQKRDVFKDLETALNEEIRKKKIICEDFKSAYETQ